MYMVAHRGNLRESGNVRMEYMSASLRLVSVNVERSVHLEKVLIFLSKEKPDIVCVQELCEPDIPAFEKALGAACFFAPMKHNARDGPLTTEGVGIFSRLKVRSRTTEWYVGAPGEVPIWDWTSLEKIQTSEHRVLLTVQVEKNGTVFQIATTHFSWSPNGTVTDFQRGVLKRLLPLLEAKKEIVFCGDLNAPRGGEIFDELAKKYTDNIPARYVSSLDGKLHRAGHLDWMVDCLFSTPKYNVTDVALTSGVSDHCAVTATIAA